MRSFVETERIYLLLGTACNFHCRYCVQRQLTKPTVQKRASEQVIEFLQQQADRRPRNNGLYAPLKVILFGGEPLLYFDVIKDVIARVNRPNIAWTIDTNGSLLTDEIVDYCNALGIRVCVSWDGAQTAAVRGRDVLDEPKLAACIGRIKKLSIDAVLTAYNFDPYQIRERIARVLGSSRPVRMTFLKVDPSMPPDIVDYDLTAWKAVCNRMADAALKQFQEQRFTEKDWESAFYRNYINSYYDVIEGKRLFNAHGIDAGRLHLDLTGRVWFCCHGVDQLGTVTDTCRDLAARAANIYSECVAKNKAHCSLCRWFAFCRGRCPYETMNPVSKRQCEFLAVFFQSVENLMHRFEAWIQDQGENR